MRTNRKPDVPTYKLHKATGQAYAIFNGKRRYFGRRELPESKARYDQAVAEWLANGRRVRVAAPDLSVAELCAAFMRHAVTYYRKPDGTPTGTPWNYKAATGFLDRLYGTTDTAAFTPQALKAVREAMVRADWSRKTVNQGVNLIRAVFRWAVSEGMVPVAVHTALTALTALRRGRCDAREGGTIRPVADAIVDATLPHLSPTVKAMVELQRLTGMRPGEVCIMRSCDVNTEGRIWEYRPSSHKTEHHEKERVVFIGPRAQTVLRPVLSLDLRAFIFSPERSVQEHLERRHEARETPAWQGNEPGTNRTRHPKRSPGERFTTDSYRQAIEYACAKAWPVPDAIVDKPEAVKQWLREHGWAPNQLRHTFATNARREHGIEAVKILLGHSDLSTSEIYAERDSTVAKAVMQKIG